MPPEEMPPLSRRALRERSARETEPLAGPGMLETLNADAAPEPTRTGALAWLDDDSVTARAAPAALPDAAGGYTRAYPDLLPSRPRRNPLRPGVVIPVLGAMALVGAYAATTLLWPLHAVAPKIDEVALPAVTAPASAVAWTADGSAAIGVAGFDTTPASSADAVPMASITKVVTALMILDEMPLAPGEQGREFAFTSRDRQTYYDYLADDESALDVPVGGTLTQYQLLQGMLIGSAGNYTDRLASTIWPSDAVFAKAARTWLDRHNLPGITVVEPTGIDPGNTADPASLITLARLAMANSVVAEIVRTPVVTLPGAGEVKNTNDLLADPAVVGIKTGSLHGRFNLLAAREQQAGDATVRVYATALGQPTNALRDSETARLLTDTMAEASTPTVLPAGTLVGTVTTKWGATAQVVTDADAAVLLWNGATATATADVSLGDARTAGAKVGDVRMKGALNEATTAVSLSADIPDPDAWWRLTHPLQLFGLAD